ncbi:PrgI family protein [Patescibacteria group bacterium]|nr:PrgI family protein [Patescibacteria group bacterium]
MKTTVIPAQITTVEDKIAGNLNLTQIVLLLSSLFIGTFVYTVLPNKMEFTAYKIPLIIFEFALFAGLSIRIKERIVLQWLIVFIRYWMRPRIYVFNKNELYLRNVERRNKKSDKSALSLAKQKPKDKKESKEAPSEILAPLSEKQKKFGFKLGKKGKLNLAVYD